MLLPTPEVSFVLCIYNGEKYLKQAIDSVLGQSFNNFELILVDDGSTDSTLEIIRNYEKKDSRCRVFAGPNRGVIPARNFGINQANGDFIALMDADDICMPNRLTMQIQYLHDHPECVAVGSRVMLIDPDGNNLTTLQFAETHEEIDNANLARQGCSIVNPSAVIRKASILEVGLYREEYNFAEDIDLFLRLAEVGKLANLAAPLVHYRQHLSSIGYKHTHAQRASVHKAVSAAEVRRGLPNSEGKTSTASQTLPTSLYAVYSKWAWWALHGGNVAVARRHGWRAIRTKPFRIANLRLLMCLIRGR